MTNILITGATGNIGMEVLNALTKIDHRSDIYAGVRDIESDSKKTEKFKVKNILFDFTNSDTCKPAIQNMDILFLLRPPQISDVKKYFKPLIDAIKESSIKHIVFLSVQGVEKSKIIPHHKIEQLIIESKIPFTFLRPAYFMQNFMTTLRADIIDKNRIYLPAGSAKFTLVDVSDVGYVAAIILTEIEAHLNKSYELTNTEKLSFFEMAAQLSQILNRKINYISPNLLTFYLTKRREKVPAMLALVMIMLHYLPRFQKEPKITDCIEKIFKRQPKSFKHFIIENQMNLR
jgi:uncharacterized protein YbjT (DUF2867 family)